MRKKKVTKRHIVAVAYLSFLVWLQSPTSIMATVHLHVKVHKHSWTLTTPKGLFSPVHSLAEPTIS